MPSSSVRSPQRFPPISAARAGPQAGRIRLTQGAALRELSRRATSSSLLELADHHPQRGRRPHGVKRCAAASNPRSLALTWHAPSHPASLTSLFHAFSGDAGGRLDTSGTLASFWPASADAVPPAAPSPPPPRLRTLVFECVDWPSGQLPTVPGPCIGGLRGW